MQTDADLIHLELAAFHISDHFSCVVWWRCRDEIGTMIQELLRRGFAQDPGVDGVRRTI